MDKNGPKDAAELRRMVDQQLAPDSVSDWAWETAEEFECVWDCLTGHATIAEFMKRIRRLETRPGGKAPRQAVRRQEENIPLLIPPAEEELREALADYLFLKASERRDVQAYRRRYQPDGLLPSGYGLTCLAALQGGTGLVPGQGEELRGVLDALIANYPWTETDAAGFLIEGSVPRLEGTTAQIRSFHGEAGHYERIVLEFDLRADADQIARTVRSIQRLRLGKDNCSLTERRRRVFRFVVEQRRGQPGVTLTELWRRWKREHAGEEYDSAPSFSKAFREAECRLTGIRRGQIEEEAALFRRVEEDEARRLQGLPSRTDPPFREAKPLT